MVGGLWQVGGRRRAIVQGACWLAVVLASGGGRSWALTRGQFCDCTIHETAKTVPNTQNSSSSSTKTPILCSKRPKIGVPKGKSAQKPQFCARNARKRGVRSQKAHKNLDFVLEMPENGGYEAKKSTKTPILCSGSPKIGVPKGKSAQKYRFCAREEGDW